MIDNLAISRIGYSTIRFTGTSESGSVAYIIQDAPGSEPSQYATPTGTEEVTPGEPFSFDVEGIAPGEKQVWVGDATEAPSAWMQTVVPDTSLADVVIWTDPSRQSITPETERIIYYRRGGVAYATRVISSGIRTIWEGSAKTAWFASVNADTISGISSKTTISGRDYYNLSNSAWYLEWDYNSTFECDCAAIHFYTSGTNNGVADIIRDRAGELTKLGEIDTNAGSDGPENADLSPMKTAHATLSGSFSPGDKLRIKRKDGETNNVRVFSVVLYASGSPIDGYPFWGTGWSPLTTASAPGSSIEWAYNVTIDSQGEFVGNVAHQSPWPESNRSIEYRVNGVSVTSGGAYFGEVEIYRSADIDMDGVTAASSYEMVTSWTVDGIRCEHELVFNVAATVTTAYIGMFPGHPSHTEANGNGIEADISSDDGNAIQLGSGTQMQIASTTAGNLTTLVLGSECKCHVVKQTTATGNKLYAALLSAEKSYESGESIVGSWDLVLGMPR